MAKSKWISYSGKPLTQPHEVNGYSELSDRNKKLFENFLKNFYSVWEYPEEHQPEEVKFISKDNYLKVTFSDMWLHVVKDGKEWY